MKCEIFNQMFFFIFDLQKKPYKQLITKNILNVDLCNWFLLYPPRRLYVYSNEKIIFKKNYPHIS